MEKALAKFKAFRLTEADRKVRGEFVECTLDDLDPGDVVVRVAYSDVNYKDALAATGKGRILRRASCIGGIDFSGTVVSSSDERFEKGDAVLGVGFDLGVAHDGGYSEYARVPGDWLVKLAGFTAGIAIVRMEHNGLKPANGPVIVNGATGGVGSIALSALAKRGYDVVALTGKAGEADWLKKLGAKEVKLRGELDLTKIKPLDKAVWAGAVDNLGGDILAWIASTMKVNGVIASIGLAASANLNTTVMPFILRGASLLGINSTDSPSQELRLEVWRRLATDLRPPALKDIVQTIPFERLPTVFERFISAQVRGRIVVDLAA